MMLVEEKKMSELSTKILKGMQIAIKKLVEETAARNGELVVGDKDGIPKHVSAKALLETVKQY